MEQLQEEYLKLLAQALAAREKAYAPYSKFRVGAALLTESGDIFTGCNVENASYGLANCAERTAVYKAVSEGHTKFQAIAVVTDLKQYVSPCGACRQVLVEFGPDIQVVMGDGEGNFFVKTSSQLLPFSFTSEELNKLAEE
ncbi:MAG: cytidine deaminase [Clostridia bacterium]|nr:cytidine deaminase [Clostridia bacterium]